MKRYLLLRDNRETGPWTSEEFIQMGGLYPLDLVWTEGESHCWAYPSEVDELKPLVREREKKPLEAAVKASELSSGRRGYVPEEELSPLRPMEPLRERVYELTKTRKGIWRRRISRSTNAGNLLRLAAVVVGLFPGAFIIQKLTDAFSGTETYSPPVVAKVVAELPGVQVSHHTGGSKKGVEKTLLNAGENEIRGTVTVNTMIIK